MRRIPIRLSPATVLASIALLVALSGTSIAAVEATLQNNSVGTAQLKNNAVTTPKIANNAVTAAKIKNAAVAAAKIASNAVVAAKVASNAVTSAKIASNAVVAAKIASNAVTSAKIASGAVTNSDLAANAVTSAKVAAGSLTASDFAAGQLPAGPTGAAGPVGPTGPPGTPATSLWAVVNANGTIARQKGVVSASHVDNGRYRVQFNQTISACAWLATIGSAAEGTSFGFIEVELSSGSTNTVVIGTQNTNGNFADRGFHLAIFC
jgi:hypothetical protein